MYVILKFENYECMCLSGGYSLSEVLVVGKSDVRRVLRGRADRIEIWRGEVGCEFEMVDPEKLEKELREDRRKRRCRYNRNKRN